MGNATVKWLHFQIQELPQIFQETLSFEALRYTISSSLIWKIWQFLPWNCGLLGSRGKIWLSKTLCELPMMSAALKWQNTFITVISHYKKWIRKPPHYFFCEALSTTHDNYLIIACNCNTLVTLSLCTKNTTNVHFCSMRNHHKLLQQVIPNKFIFNFIPCTK